VNPRGGTQRAACSCKRAISRPCARRCWGPIPFVIMRPLTQRSSEQWCGPGTPGTETVVISSPCNVGTGSGTGTPASLRRAASHATSEAMMSAVS
jgi:hypothetical protein